jgi:hypothetical protein
MVEVLERPVTKQPVIFDLPTTPIPEQSSFHINVSKKDNSPFAAVYHGESMAEAMARMWLGIEGMIAASERMNVYLSWDHFIIHDSDSERPTMPEYPVNFLHPDGTGVVKGTLAEYEFIMKHNLAPKDLKQILESQRNGTRS